MNGKVIDASFAARHQPVVVEFPQFVAVAAPPLAGSVMTFVLETHRDSVAVEVPQAFTQRIVEFSLPFGGEEFDDLVACQRSCNSPGVGGCPSRNSSPAVT